MQGTAAVPESWSSTVFKALSDCWDACRNISCIASKWKSWDESCLESLGLMNTDSTSPNRQTYTQRDRHKHRWTDKHVHRVHHRGCVGVAERRTWVSRRRAHHMPYGQGKHSICISTQPITALQVTCTVASLGLSALLHKLSAECHGQNFRQKAL